ncbi:hypothetical protein [Micromonospora parathelypteridis]|uniref:Uncharacterized protein n=1 Tax=Micromonospora parathelypteridis TaxID=1839617 RepID=A0A840W3P8_9ACTN|nr:hypothetical protein [Micromonospora parathelypteridis]MBB5479748.1 hypothetical protein [Micromonospora parathelypteridis]GGO31363.1 hypothetical protein GCM10011576_60110 [Micromonospora parathelypteridis]
MDVNSEARRAGESAEATGRRGWKRFVERATGLQIMAVYWVPMTLLIGLPVRWLFDRQESLVEAVLNAALSVVWIGPSVYLGQRVVGDVRRDPDGYALRTGTVPEDDAARADLPAYLAGQRRATWAALLFIMGVSLGLVLLALLGADNEGFAVIFSAVAVVSVAVAAFTLTRIRRLTHLLAAPNPPGPRE